MNHFFEKFRIEKLDFFQVPKADFASNIIGTHIGILEDF